MRIVPFAIGLLLLTTIAVAASPLAEARPDLPPEYIGGYCGFHYHPLDLDDGTPPTYHYHHCI